MKIFLADEQEMNLDTSDVVPLADLVMTEERLPADSEVAIVLIDSDEMARYNERYMGKEGSTDVLSFPIEDGAPGVPPGRDPDGPPLNIGDIFIAPDVVRANADQSGAAFRDEFALVVVHGVLHLLGWDHQIGDEAERMEARERELLATMGLTRP